MPETSPSPTAGLHAHSKSRRPLLSALAGLLALALTAAAYIATANASDQPSVSFDLLYQHESLRSYEIMIGVCIAAFLLQPAFGIAVARTQPHLRKLYTGLALLAVCIFMACFLIHTGRHQFGGFDFGILMDIGWRQVSGQHLYTDFLAPTPPAFNLGIKYAFELFGVSWNANLYLSAIFSCATFLWMYWLMRRLGLSALAAIGAAFTVECSTMLLLSFWWYNDSTMVLAAVFFLACFAYIHQPRSAAIQVSYVGALALLALTKPNTAGIAIAGGVFLLLIAARPLLRSILLTLAAGALVLLVFAANHISVAAMLGSYREASKFRGGFSNFGFTQLGHFEQRVAKCAVAALTVLWLWLLPQTIKLVRARDWRGLALHLFFPLVLLVCIYSLRTNGEFWQVECAPLIVAGAVLTFGMRVPPLLGRRVYAAMLCGFIAHSLYVGTARLRVFTIGQFFSWTDNESLIPSGALKDLRVSTDMAEMEQQIAAVKATSSGPYFLGPRIDFNYAVLHIPSPLHYPAWFHPGVSFAMDREPELMQVWQSDRFQTLVFLKGDYTFYPPVFLEALARDYLRDDSYSQITVYRRR